MEVSIVVPCYNVKEYIVRSIESVLNQSFFNWEMLLVDDGSTDGTSDICKTYASKEKRIKYFYQENQGQGIARNYGIKKASGKYVFFLDPDDWIRSDTLEKLYIYAEKEKLDLIFFDRIVVKKDIENKIKNYYCKLPIQITKVTDCVETPELLYLLEGSLCDKFYRKEILSGIKQKGHPYEDAGILPCILVKAKRIGQIKEAFYYYWNCRDDSTTNKNNTVYIKDSMKEAYDSLRRHSNWELYKNHLKKYLEWNAYVAKYHMQNKAYNDDEGFVQECIELVDKLYPDERKMRSKQYCVWGSYNLRSMVNRVMRKLRSPKCCYSFCNITSLMQERNGNEIVRKVHPNPYREQMIQMDVEQSFRCLTQDEYKGIDYVCIDLLEERFLPVSNNGEYITGSDALQEVTDEFISDISYLGSEAWKENVLKFIRFLKKNFESRQIILVENYLCTGYGMYGAEKSFENEYGDINYTNIKLKECYKYFEEMYEGIHVITNTRKELEFTDIEYPHGCFPWHQNEYLYYEVAEKIEDIVQMNI